MSAAIFTELTTHGYVFLPSHESDSETIEVAAKLGRPLVPWNNGLVQRLIPRADAPPNTYSGIYGLERFPFHTDLAHWRTPPRYLLLRCISGYTDVPTLLVDGRALTQEISSDILGRAVFKTRRPKGGAVALLRLCERVGDGYRIRWDETFLRPASRIGNVADLRVRAWLAACHPLTVSLVDRGDTLLIDNWRMMHARSPIPRGRESRIIERVYLGALN